MATRQYLTGEVRADSEIETRTAVPGDADSIATLYDEVYSGAYPILDCVDPERIRRILSAGEHVWIVALHGNKLVGSMVGRSEPANRSYEGCRAAVLPHYAGQGAFTEVFRMTISTSIARPDCDMIYGYGRTEHAMQIFGSMLPIAWLGTDGGMHVVGDNREEHVIGISFVPSRRITRVVPPHPLLDPSTGLARTIAAMDVITQTGDYPARVVSGCGADSAHVSPYGRVSYSFFEPSRAMTIHDVEADSVQEIHRAVWHTIDNAAMTGPAMKIEHVIMHVLADKHQVIAQMCPANERSRRRFAMSGYLPGWHQHGDARYDCVPLTARFDDRMPKLLGTQAIAEEIRRSLPAAYR